MVGHGNFEGWCEQNLQCKLRKAQYYMLLAKPHAETDIVSLNPQSLRQALAYAGALPAAEKKKRPAGKSDELAHIGKTIDKLLVELKANGDRSAKELLKLTQPLIDWRNDLAARMSQRQKPIVLLDVEATVKSKDKAKTHHARTFHL